MTPITNMVLGGLTDKKLFTILDERERLANFLSPVLPKRLDLLSYETDWAQSRRATRLGQIGSCSNPGTLCYSCQEVWIWMDNHWFLRIYFLELWVIHQVFYIQLEKANKDCKWFEDSINLALLAVIDLVKTTHNTTSIAKIEP